MSKLKSKSPPQRDAQPAPRLTGREKEVLELLLRGLSDKLIGADLGITYNGTRRHVDSLLKKFSVNSRLQLAAAFLKIDRAQ